MNVFHKNPLVSEHVTSHFQAQAMIRVVDNLLGFTVSSKHLEKNSHPPHPGYLLSHSSIDSTLWFTSAICLPFLQAKVFFRDQAWGMDNHRLLDHQSIFDQLPDLLMGVGNGDFIGLTGV